MKLVVETVVGAGILAAVGIVVVEEWLVVGIEVVAAGRCGDTGLVAAEPAETELGRSQASPY